MFAQEAGSRRIIARRSLLDQSAPFMRSETTIAEFCQEYLRARNIEPTPPPAGPLAAGPAGVPQGGVRQTRSPKGS